MDFSNSFAAFATEDAILILLLRFLYAKKSLFCSPLSALITNSRTVLVYCLENCWFFLFIILLLYLACVYMYTLLCLSDR